MCTYAGILEVCVCERAQRPLTFSPGDREPLALTPSSSKYICTLDLIGIYVLGAYLHVQERNSEQQVKPFCLASFIQTGFVRGPKKNIF